MAVSRVNATVECVRLLEQTSGARPIAFTQNGLTIRLQGPPAANPDSVAGIPVLKFTFREPPQTGSRFVVQGAGAEA